jgi:hypothetical protein
MARVGTLYLTTGRQVAFADCFFRLYVYLWAFLFFCFLSWPFSRGENYGIISIIPILSTLGRHRSRSRPQYKLSLPTYLPR